MSLSSRSIERLAGALQEDFSVFLGTEYADRLNEVLSDAVVEFLDNELGEVDEVLYYDLALLLLDGVRIN